MKTGLGRCKKQIRWLSTEVVKNMTADFDLRIEPGLSVSGILLVAYSQGPPTACDTAWCNSQGCVSQNQISTYRLLGVATQTRRHAQFCEILPIVVWVLQVIYNISASQKLFKRSHADSLRD